MLQDLGNKLVAKTDKLQEPLSKEIEDLRIKQAEIQNTITEIKKSLEATNSKKTGGRRMNKRVGGQTTENH